MFLPNIFNKKIFINSFNITIIPLLAFIIKDFLLGTILGTVPGILPFVMIGSSGLKAIKTGDFLPLMFALGLTGMLIGVSTWYRRRRRNPRQDLENKN